MQLFVGEPGGAPSLHRALAHELPTTFAGFPTSFGPPVDPSGSRLLVAVDAGPVDHLVETWTVGGFFRERLGVDPRDGLTATDWLVTPAERLLEVTAGEVFADPRGARGLTAEVDATTRQFYGRPFRVLFADRLADALRDGVSDPHLRAIGHRAGGIDAVSDNTDVLTRPHLWRRLTGLYDRVETREERERDGV